MLFLHVVHYITLQYYTVRIGQIYGFYIDKTWLLRNNVRYVDVVRYSQRLMQTLERGGEGEMFI
jgi:hypothetical protein